MKSKKGSSASGMDISSQLPPSLIFTIIILAILIMVLIISGWKVFEKAGRPGWKAIVPILNTITFIQIAGRSAWWFLLMLLPVVGLIFSVIVTVDFAKKFDKNHWFAVGIMLLPFIFYPLLAFGDSRYQGESSS